MFSRKMISTISIISLLIIINIIPIGVNAVISFADEVSVDDVNTITESIPDQISNADVNIHLVNRVFDPLAEQPNLLLNVNSNLLYSEPTDYSLIQFNGPVLDEWKQDVEDAGAYLLSYIPDYAFTAKLPQAARSSVESLDSVRWAGPFHPYYKLTPALANTLTLDDELRDAFLGASAKYTIDLFDTSLTGI